MLPQHMCGTRFAESAQTGMVASQSGLRRTVRKVFARHHAVKPSSSFRGGFCQTHNPSNLDCRPTVSEEATSLLSENEFAVTVPRVPFLHQTRWLGNPEQPSFFSSSLPFSRSSFLSHPNRAHRAVWRDPFSTHGIFHGTIRNSTRVYARPTAPEIQLNWHRRASGAAVGREKKSCQTVKLASPSLTVSPWPVDRFPNFKPPGPSPDDTMGTLEI